ncbi:alpha/beta fold hydrolase, partial [Kibdelosporangium lantanae]
AGLMCLDVLPTVDMWDVLHGVHASVAWHLYLMAQPAGLPERMIEADPDLFFGHFLDVWSTTEIPADVRREYLAACRDSIASIVADYRASAFEDIDDDTMDKQQGNQLGMPVTVIQHDWGFDGRDRWHAWAPQLEHHTVTHGHFMAEDAPEAISAAIRKLESRTEPAV